MSAIQPQSKDIDLHLNKMLDKMDAKGRRDYEYRGEIADAFVQMRKILRGTNTTENLRKVRQSQDDAPASIDISGWTIENDNFMSYQAKVDGAMSVKYDIYPRLILALDKVGQTEAVSKQVANDMAKPTETFVAEKPGLLDSFRNAIGALRPKWKQELDQGISMLSSLFEDPHVTVGRWEAYKNQHWKNVMKAVEFEPEQFWPVMVLELHALADVEMRVMRMVYAAIEMRATEQAKNEMNVVGQIIQSKTAAMQQQAMMPGVMPMQSLPSGNGHS